jgi:hypothetical protein
MRAALIAAVLLVSTAARAQDLKDRFNIRLYLTGMYLVEQESSTAARQAQQASTAELGYADLRMVIDGRRLRGSGWDLHLDGRVRLTNEYNYYTAQTGGDQTFARGYLQGGREYELRQAWLLHRGLNWDVGFGRIVVAEADALKLDGARLWYRPSTHWAVSLFAGGAPDPFSRSLPSDYFGGFGIAGGATTGYTYDKIWGSLSINGEYLSGNNDGGPLVGDPTTTAAYALNPTTETPLVWATWTNFVRLASWFDVYHDLVVDLAGSAGVQLRRLDVLGTMRLGRYVTLRLGYDHLSAYAIEMWLTRLLQSQQNFQHLAGTIENNLIVDRTARDEARGQLDVSFGNVSIFGEGRFRRRAIVSLADDPQFVRTGEQVAPGIAYDVTVGMRDRGSVWQLRPTVWLSYISDYRSRNIIFDFDIERRFLDDRLGLDLAFLYANTKDVLSGPPPVQCNPGLPQALDTCFGTRDGAEYELGFTLWGQPGKHWFAFFDYRMVANTTNGTLGTLNVNGTMTTPPQPTLFTHVLLLRLEMRY